MNPIHENIVKKLISLTEKGDIKWSSTSLQDKYSTTLAPYVISIYVDRNLEFMPLLNQIMAEIEFSETSGEVFDKTTLYESNSKDYNLLSSLQDMAHRQALGIDKKLSDINQLLGEH